MARDMRTGTLEGLQGQSEVTLRTPKSVGRTIRGTLRESGLNPSRRKLLRQADEEVEAMMQRVKCLVALGHVAATGVPPAGFSTDIQWQAIFWIGPAAIDRMKQLGWPER